MKTVKDELIKEVLLNYCIVLSLKNATAPKVFITLKKVEFKLVKKI